MYPIIIQCLYHMFTGHSWGGRHDDATSECSPSNNRGGKYIMYAVAQDGEAPNNMVGTATLPALLHIDTFN